MATKLEYETQIRELQAKLAALDPGEIKRRDQRIFQLEQEVDLARQANERMNADLTLAENYSALAKSQLDSVTQAFSELQSGVSAQTRELSQARAEASASAEIAHQLSIRVDELDAAGTMVGDYAVIDGKPFRVVKRYLAKWLHQDVQRRFIGEDTTVVSLDRTGE